MFSVKQTVFSDPTNKINKNTKSHSQECSIC